LIDSTPIYSSASREHIQRVFLDTDTLFVFSTINNNSDFICSGNQGVLTPALFFDEFQLRFFPEEYEEVFNSEFFHRSWPEFLLMNSWSTKIVVLAVVLASLYVQCTSSD